MGAVCDAVRKRKEGEKYITSNHSSTNLIKIRNYSLGRRLGKGGFGEVYLATNLYNKQKVALKKLDLSEMNFKEITEAFTEANKLMALKHENIVECFETFQESNAIYLSLEYCDQGDLKKIIANKKNSGCGFSDYEINHILIQLALAISHMHKKRLLHRDLKPANVFLTSTGVIKLGDFGLATILNSEKTQANSKVGSRLYMAPEIYQGIPYSYPCDIWAFGIIAYELCFFEHPFLGRTESETIYNILHKKNVMDGKKCFVTLKEIIKECLFEDPTKRIGIDSIFKILKLIAENFSQPQKLDIIEKEKTTKNRDTDFLDEKTKKNVLKCPNGHPLKWIYPEDDSIKCIKCGDRIRGGRKCNECRYRICDKCSGLKYLNTQCPNGRPLIKWIPPGSDFTNCIKCGDYNRGGRKCNGCRYRICDKCSGLKYLNNQCPNGHSLGKWIYPGGDNTDCVKCGDAERGGRKCNDCKYRICDKCSGFKP